MNRSLIAVIALCLSLVGGCANGYPIMSVLRGGHGGAQPIPLSVSLSPGSPASVSATTTTSGPYTTNAASATASGGRVPYSYAWTYASGSATPTADTPSAISTTFTATTVSGTTYASVWKVTVTDASLNTATANVLVNFIPNTTFPLDVLAHGIVGDNILQTQLQNPKVSGVPKPKVNYCEPSPTTGLCTTSFDFANWNNAGITYMRVPIDVQQVIPNLPYPTGYLANVTATSGTYNSSTGLVTLTLSNATNLTAGSSFSMGTAALGDPPTGTGSVAQIGGGPYTAATGTSGTTLKYTIATGLTMTITGATVDSVYKPLAGSMTGCADVYFSSSCVVAWNLAYLDNIVTSANAHGIAVDFVPFVAGTIPATVNMQSGNSNTSTGSLRDDMGAGTNCYGYSVMSGATCYEQMLLVANTTLMTRYASLTPSQAFFEFENEPLYKTDVTGHSAYQNPNLYNTSVRAITAAMRAIDSTHWLIVPGLSSSKAQFFYAMTPSSDAKSVYVFHKYDPDIFVDQTNGQKQNQLLLYPRENTGEAAIGRPGGVVSATLPTRPVKGTPSYQTTVDGFCTGSAWTNPLTGVGQKKACVGTSTTPTDYYTPAIPDTNPEVTKDDLLNNPTNGVQLAINWATSGGHGLGIENGSWSSGTTTLTMYDDPTLFLSIGNTITVSGVGAKTSYNGTFTISGLTSTTISYAQASTPGNYNNGCIAQSGTKVCSYGVVTSGSVFSDVKKIILGEMGYVHAADYRSRIQFLIDLRSVLDSNGVPGGQASIPWEMWSFTGQKFGIRPKANSSPNVFCLGIVGNVSGYDLDDWSVLATPQNTIVNGLFTQTPYSTPYCTSSTAATYGTPGLP